MTRTAFRLELRRNRSLLIWLGLVTVLYAGFIGYYYPIMRDNLSALEEYMKIMPKAILAAFGMEGSLGSPGVFFATYIGSWLWPIIAAIGGILVGTRATAADLDRGFLELPLATPISRTRYLGASIAGQVVLMAVLATLMVVAVLAIGAVVDAGFEAGRFAPVIPLSFALGCAVAGIVTLLAVATLSRGRAGGITVGLLFGMYLAQVISKLDPGLADLGRWTLFGHFATGPVIDRGEFPAGDIALFVAIAAITWIAALAAFRRRDLAA